MVVPRIQSDSRKGETKVYIGTAQQEQFEGGYGTDIFRGMGGSDTFRGGYGTTIVDFSWALGRITVDLSKDFYQQTGGAGLNRFVEIKGIFGSAFDDVIWGHTHNDILKGNGGNDEIHGSEGADQIDGGAGNDRLFGGAAPDSIVGGLGDDSLYGEGQNDALNGDGGNDLVDGGAGNDDLKGGVGNDKLIGGLGIDLIDGGDGFDTASFITATAAVTIDRRDLSGNSNRGEAQFEAYTRIEAYELTPYADLFIGHGETVTVMGGAGADRITGGGGRDTLYGGTGNDVIDGGRENDVLYGEDGDDILDGGYEASDYLWGGKGNDIFKFSPGSSQSRYPDQILDFERGDKIDLTAMDPKPGGADDKLLFTSSGVITAAGQVTFVRVDADWLRVFADTNGDKVADFFLLVHTNLTLTQSDFNL
jgi:Ca2+-binding RTX toxin-like protein